MTDRRTRRFAFAFAATAFLVYNANRRLITEGDSIPARYLPFVFLTDGGPRLDSLASLATRPQRGNHPYWLVPSRDGHLLSLYPVVTPMLVTPLYVLPVLALEARGWTERNVLDVALVMEKLSASLVAAISGGLVFLLVRRRVTEARALLLAAAYAFGTSTFVISSQALWQHGPAELLFALALLGAVGPGGPLRLAGTGFCLGLLIANRPPDVLLALPVIAALLIAEGKRAWVAVAAAAVPVALSAAYGLVFFGHVAGGYGAIGLAGPHLFYDHPIGAGIAGLLVSPGRGLLFFSPFLVFLLGWRRRDVAERRERLLASAVAAGAVALLVFYARTDWRAGGCYGPRFLIDMLPGLVFLLAPVVARLGARGLVAFSILVLASCAIQTVGIVCYPRGESDRAFYPVEGREGVIPAAVWRLDDSPVLVEARAGAAAPELAEPLRRVARAIARGR